MFELNLKSIALKGNWLCPPLISQASIIVFFDNRLIFSEALFMLLVGGTGLLILRNVAQNIYGLLVLALEHDYGGPALLPWLPMANLLLLEELLRRRFRVESTAVDIRCAQCNNNGCQAANR